jgi:hypothetical protein
LDQLRDGDPAAAVAAYAGHDRIVLGDTAEALRDQLVADWWAASGGQPDPSVVMIAARRSDVADLNERARARMHAAGLLRGDELVTADGWVFQPGDRVMALRNDQRAGVVNGTRGRIVTLDTEDGSVTVRTDEGREIELPQDYLDAGHLDHGYAITAHKAQGVTVERALILGSETIYREWGYVALSRARHGTRLYLLDHRSGDRHANHGALRRRDDPLLALVQRLERSEGRRLADDHGQPATAVHTDTAVSGDQLRQRLLATMPRPVDRQCTVLDEQISQAHARVSELEDKIAEGEQTLSVLRRRTGRLSRRHAANGLVSDLARDRGDLAAWQRQLQRLTAEQADLDLNSRHLQQWGRDHARELAAYAHSIRAAEAAARIGATIQEITAPAARPDNPTQRARWRRELTEPTRQQLRETDALELDTA